MPSYQMISKQTGADLKTVKKCARAVIGNKHKATTEEIHNIIKMIKKEINK